MSLELAGTIRSAESAFLAAAERMCVGNTTVSDYLPTTLREVVDPHHFRTNSKAEKRHAALGIHQPGIPEVADPLPPPQAAKAPDTAPLRRRNVGGIAIPAGSTLLSGPSGIAMSQLNLGSQTLLGGN